MKLTYSRSIYFCALIWGMIGLRLLSKGMMYFSLAHQSGDYFVSVSSPLKENLFSIWISISLLLGWIKGKFILTKSVDRMVRHIVSFDEPLKWKSLFPKSFFMVMFAMMLLGLSLKHLPLSDYIKGGMDTTIATALLYGAWIFYRKGKAINQALKDL